MRQAYAGSNYRVRHVQSAVHDAHLPFTGMQLKVFVREPSEDVPQCRDTYPSKNGKRYEVIPIHAPAWGATFLRQFPQNRRKVSIHAPAWGATVCQESPLFSPGYNEHFDDLDSSAGKSCASSGEGSIFCFITT